MVRLAVFCTVILAYLSISKVESLSHINIENFLQSLQQQLQLEQQQQLQNEQQKSYYLKDKGDRHYGSLKKRHRDKILDRPIQKSRNLNENQYGKHRRPFSQSLKLVPNKLLSFDNLNQDDESSFENNYRENDDKKNEYSKVYIVLNSEAIRKSKNKDKLNTLLSNLLAPPPQREKTRHHQNQHQEASDRYHDRHNQYKEKRVRFRDKHDQYLEQRHRHQHQDDRYQQKHNRHYHDDRYPGGRIRYQDDSDWHQSESERYNDHYQNRQEYDGGDWQRDQSYKGLFVNDDNRRKMARESNERYEPIDEPRPLRQREYRERPRRGREHGGGGGGYGGYGGGGYRGYGGRGGHGNQGSFGGHTAIPYIRQHGDIYEKADWES